MISDNITIESTLKWAKNLSDEQLFLLIEDLNTISDERRKIISRHNKQCLSYSNRRNFCCPMCGFPVVKNGKRKDGAQIYRCKNPERHHQFVSTSGTSFSASKITDEKIKQIITLILLGCPVWVVAWIADTTAKTVAFWRDRCLDAAVDWASATTLCDHVWFDEQVMALQEDLRRVDMPASRKLSRQLRAESKRRLSLLMMPPIAITVCWRTMVLALSMMR